LLNAIPGVNPGRWARLGDCRAAGRGTPGRRGGGFGSARSRSACYRGIGAAADQRQADRYERQHIEVHLGPITPSCRWECP
jgi:hypothetical protein